MYCYILFWYYQQCIIEVAAGGVLHKICSLKFRKICRKTPVPELFFKKFVSAGNFIYDETLAQVFSGDFCEIVKKNFLNFFFAVIKNRIMRLLASKNVVEIDHYLIY